MLFFFTAALAANSDDSPRGYQSNVVHDLSDRSLGLGRRNAVRRKDAAESPSKGSPGSESPKFAQDDSGESSENFQSFGSSSGRGKTSPPRASRDYSPITNAAGRQTPPPLPPKTNRRVEVRDDSEDSEYIHKALYQSHETDRT